MWAAWLELELELKEGTPFDPVFELMNSAEAPKLLASIPQLDVPVAATATTDYQTTLNDVKTASVQVDPIDFQHTNAIVDSGRSVYAHITKGKILACRKPDLMIHNNRVISSRQWELVGEA